MLTHNMNAYNTIVHKQSLIHQYKKNIHVIDMIKLYNVRKKIACSIIFQNVCSEKDCAQSYYTGIGFLPTFCSNTPHYTVTYQHTCLDSSKNVNF